MQRLALESFDGETASEPADLGNYQEGYDAGFAAAQQSLEAAQDRLASELVQSLADIDFTYAEARAELTKSFNQLLAVVADKLLPSLVSDFFAAEVFAAVRQVADEVVAAPVTLAVHPTQQPAIDLALKDASLNIKIRTDETLPEHAFELRHHGETRLLDMDALQDRISEILNAKLTTQESEAHIG